MVCSATGIKFNRIGETKVAAYFFLFAFKCAERGGDTIGSRLGRDDRSTITRPLFQGGTKEHVPAHLAIAKAALKEVGALP
jgi:hypothetical protein